MAQPWKIKMAAFPKPSEAERAAWRAARVKVEKADPAYRTPAKPQPGPDPKAGYHVEPAHLPAMQEKAGREQLWAKDYKFKVTPSEFDALKQQAAAKAAVQVGAKGGRFYVTPNGTKVYLKD